MQWVVQKVVEVYATEKKQNEEKEYCSKPMIQIKVHSSTISDSINRISFMAYPVRRNR